MKPGNDNKRKHSPDSGSQDTERPWKYPRLRPPVDSDDAETSTIRSPIYRGEFDLFVKDAIKDRFLDKEDPSLEDIHDEIVFLSPPRNAKLVLHRKRRVPTGSPPPSWRDSDGYLRSPLLCDPVGELEYHILIGNLKRTKDGQGEREASSQSLRLSKHYDHLAVFKDTASGSFSFQRKWARMDSNGRVFELFSCAVTFRVSLALSMPSKSGDLEEDRHQLEFWAVRCEEEREEDYTSESSESEEETQPDDTLDDISSPSKSRDDSDEENVNDQLSDDSGSSTSTDMDDRDEEEDRRGEQYNDDSGSYNLGSAKDAGDSVDSEGSDQHERTRKDDSDSSTSPSGGTGDGDEEK